jgi:hypothetical protein
VERCGQNALYGPTTSRTVESTVLNSDEHLQFRVGWVTAVLFLITGTVVGLAELGLLFREALMIGAPAVIATLLVDTFLYNEFLIRTGPGFWVILYGFLFVQSGLVAASIVALARYVSRRDESELPANE